MGVCNFLGSVSSQQKFEATDVKALRQTVSQLLDKSVLQLHVTAQFYLENKRKVHPRGVRARRHNRCKEKRVRDTVPFGSSFSYVFPTPLHPGSALCKLG